MKGSETVIAPTESTRPSRRRLMMALARLTGAEGVTPGLVKKCLAGPVEPGAVDWVLRRSADFALQDKDGTREAGAGLARDMKCCRKRKRSCRRRRKRSCGRRRRRRSCGRRRRRRRRRC